MNPETLQRFRADFGPFKAVARKLPADGRTRDSDPTRWVVRSKIGEDVACCACEDAARILERLLNDHDPAVTARLREQIEHLKAQLAARPPPTPAT